MAYYGDLDLEDVIDWKFTTVDSTGAPATLTGSGSLICYVGNSTTELTAGLTLTRGFDSRTGLNNVRVAATAANGYSLSQNYQVVVKGTVNAISISGYVVGEFSVGFRSALKPTTAKRALTVDASGRALGDVDTIKTNPVANAGTVTFPTNKTLASTDNITAGTITTVTNLTNAPTAGDLTATMKTSVQTAATAASPVLDWNKIANPTAAAPNVHVFDTGNAAITASSFQNGAIDAAAIADGAIDAATFAAGAVDAAALAADAGTEISAAVWAKAMTELTGIPAANGTVLQALTVLFMALRNKRTTTATADTIGNDAGTAIATAVLSDDATTFIKAEYA